MLYIRSSDLTFFITESLYTFTHLYLESLKLGQIHKKYGIEKGLGVEKMEKLVKVYKLSDAISMYNIL